MNVAVAVLAIAVALLTLLVAGLLRSHAEILRRLHGLEGPSGGARPDLPADGRDARPGRAAHDLAGTDAAGDAVVVRVSPRSHDTVLAFLSTGCATCRDFWEALAEPALPHGARLVIVTQDLDRESPASLADLAPPAATLVASSAAWEDYGVPGSPYVVHVDGRRGTVRGEGTGATWEQVARLLAEATGDVAYLGAPGAPTGARPDRERDADAALLRAGITPGDPRLYGPADAAR